MKNKKYIGIIVLVVVLVFIGYYSFSKPKSEAYVLMNSILSGLDSSIDLSTESVGWNFGLYRKETGEIDGRMIAVYRPGYTFSTDSQSLADAFVEDLKVRGFVQDTNNTKVSKADSQLNTRLGLSNGIMGCVIITDKDDGLRIKISCADDVRYTSNTTTDIASTTSTSTTK